MDLLANALKALPSVASSPLALVGFALTIGAWVYSYNRSRNLKILMMKIALVPEQDRKNTIVATLGDPLPDNISAEQWIVSKRQQYYFIAFVVSLLVALIIVAISLYRGTEITQAQEAAKARIAICESQIRDITNQWNRNKDNLDNRINAIDSDINVWRLEERRGATGIALAPPEQKPLALAIMNNAQAEIAELEIERKIVQEKLDVMASSPPVTVKCD